MEKLFRYYAWCFMYKDKCDQVMFKCSIDESDFSEFCCLKNTLYLSQKTMFKDRY